MSSHPHPYLFHGGEELVKGIHDEERVLKVIDFERLIDHGVERKFSPLALRAERTGGVAVRGDQSAAINLDRVVFADQSEFHGEPEEARHRLGISFRLRGRSELAEPLKKIGEDGIGVEWHVSEDVAKDVGLRQVVAGRGA